jgi:RHS repeat-associated protein
LNQVSGFTYDAAGNVLSDNFNNYLYDPEGRLCAVAYPNGSGGSYYEQYLYDAEGRRMGKGSVGSLTCAAPGAGFTLKSQYLLGQGGEQVTELNGAGAVQHTNAFIGGKLLATYDFVNGGLHFTLTDPLGTKRVQVSGAGTPELNCFSLPFGNSLGNARATNCVPAPGSLAAADATEHHFTQQRRDSTSGNDYFGARYYASSMGRWLSPDWGGSSPVPYAVFTDPQSLNLYIYMRNNVLGGVDADGHCDSGHFWCDVGMGALKYLYNASQANALFLARHGCMACGEAAGVMNMGGQPTLNIQKPSNTAEAIGYWGVPVVSTALAVVPVLNETVVVSAAVPMIETESIPLAAEVPQVSLLDQAIQARDALAATTGNDVATVTAGYNSTTGQVAAAG